MYVFSNTLQLSVPSVPLYIQTKTITSNGFSISWQEPWKIPGILQNYTITVQAVEPLHYVQEECQIDTTELYFTVDPDVADYLYDSATPNYHYVVKINASTNAGSGVQSSVEVTTLSASMDKILYCV